MVSKLSVWLSGLVSFERSAEILERVGGVHSSRGSVWQQSSLYGKKFQVEEHKMREAAKQIQLWQGIVPGEAKANKRMGVAMDGGMIHIREEGWKEVKIGCVFDIGQVVIVDEQTQEEMQVGCAVHNSYVAHLGGPEPFGQKVWAEARRRGWTSAADTQAIGDGALWIWNLVVELFLRQPASGGLVSWQTTPGSCSRVVAWGRNVCNAALAERRKTQPVPRPC